MLPAVQKVPARGQRCRCHRHDAYLSQYGDGHWRCWTSVHNHSCPVVLGLEIAALACGLLGVTDKFICQRLSIKAKTHDEVRVLAESKLNTIADHVSTALAEGTISDEEFHLVVEEAHKYAQMKAEIWAGAQEAHAAVTLDEEAKNALIQQGRDEARASFMKKLTGSWVVPVFA